MAFGLRRGWPGVHLCNLDVLCRVHQNFLYRPRGAGGVCTLALPAPRGTLTGEVHQGLISCSFDQGLCCLRGKGSSAGWVSDSGSAWVVANRLCLEVKWCCMGGKAGSQAGVWRRQSCLLSLMSRMHGGLVIGHAKSFRLFKCALWKNQCATFSFSLGGTTCLWFISC